MSDSPLDRIEKLARRITVSGFPSTPEGLLVRAPVVDPTSGEEILDPELADRVLYELRRREAGDIAKAIRSDAEWAPIPAPVSLRQAIDDAPEDVPSRIERVLPAQSRVVLNGRRKMGKTTISTNVIRAIATGSKLFDRWQAQQGRVLMLNFEVLAHQFAAWCDEAGVPLDDTHVLSLRGVRNPLGSSRGRKELERQIADLGIDVLIVDPFGAACSGIVADPDRDNGAVRAFLDSLDELAANAGVDEMILTAHLGKQGDEARGASAIEDWPDAIWTLTADEAQNRFFSAFGRDVDFPEEMLQFNHQNRRLSFPARPVNRGNAGYLTAADIALDFIGNNPGCKLRDLTDVLENAEVPGAAKNGAVGAWMTRLAREGSIVQVPGPRNSKLHYLPTDMPEGDPK